MTRRSMDDMAIDPRNDFQMLSRAECRRILTEKGIDYDPHITQTDAVILLQMNKVNPREAMPWEYVTIKGFDGKNSVKTVPKRTNPIRPEGYDERALAEVDRLSAIAIEEEKRAEKKIETLEDEISQLKALVTQLVEQKQEPMIVDEVSVVIEKPDLNKVHWKRFQKMAKEIGIEWTTRDPRGPVIEKLEAQQDS